MGKSLQRKVPRLPSAAQRFGNGEITMTTRMTLEIQGFHLKISNPWREFFGRGGLQTGGTGSEVRPVVSCKGTTCQYGLTSTLLCLKQSTSVSMRGTGCKLPHKFKIAVGGCQ